MIRTVLFIALLFVIPSAAIAAPGGNGVVPKPTWFDSYSANGRCYIDSNFDHGIGGKTVSTPIGPQTIRQVAARMGKGPGRAGNPIYNDVQCGNGPANNAGDENYDQCPGRVDQGAAGCSIIGPKWNLALVYGKAPSGGTAGSGGNSNQRCDAVGANLVIAKVAYNNACPGLKRVDCDPLVLNGRNVWMCANYNIGKGAVPVSTPTAPQQPAPAPSSPAPSSPTPNPVPVTAPTSPSAGRCDALGDTLALAKTAYARRCSARRVDCDPTGNRTQYLCASYNITGRPSATLTPLTPTQSPTPTPTAPAQPAPSPATPTPTPATPSAPSSGRCEAVGANLALARSAYAAKCSLPRWDCDPVPQGYMCASYNIGNGTPVPPQAQAPAPAPVQQPVASPPATGGVIRVEAETQSGSGWANRGGYIEFTGNNTFASPTYGSLVYNVTIPRAGDWQMRWRAKAARQTPGRVDLHNDAWARMNGSPVSGFHDVRAFRKVFSSGNGQWHIAGTVDLGAHNFSQFRQRFTPGTYQFQISGRSIGYAIDYIEFVQINGQTTGGNTSAPPVTASAPPALDPLGGIGQYLDTFRQPYTSGDLLSLHWDSSPDPDDLQAMIITREILDSRPDVDFIAVNGAKRVQNSTIVNGSSEQMKALFPSGYDAFRNGLSAAQQRNLYNSTVNTVATSWSLTLAAGNRVHVAEGGPSDFTASVINELLSRNVSVSSLKNIRVIQHSWGWNENNTTPSALLTVRRYTEYIRIANGNLGNGHGPGHTATPDYQLDASDSRCARFRSRALASRYAAQWRAAFAPINNRCDGSDAVEVTWILGIRTADVPTLQRVADRYF